MLDDKAKKLIQDVVVFSGTAIPLAKSGDDYANMMREFITAEGAVRGIEISVEFLEATSEALKGVLRKMRSMAELQGPLFASKQKGLN
jgi:hypothetical protein